MIKVLLIAYACEPNKGSEPGVGWNWAVHLSKYVNVTVVTRRNNKKVIRKAINKNSNLSFLFYDLPYPFLRIKKLLGIWGYYYLWQIYVLIYLLKIKVKNRYDIVHHVTFMSNKINLTPFLGVKNITGPVGGLELLPWNFLFFTGKPFKEFFRNILILRYKYSPFYNLYLRKVDKLILTNKNNLLKINSKFHHKILIQQIGSKDFKNKKNLINKESSNKILKLYWGGVLKRWKGLELLLYALKDININYELIVTGKGKDENYFRKIIQKLKLKNVFLKGWVNENDLEKIKEQTDIFIFTSLRETTGSILLEMMGLGKACIVLDHGGPSNIVDRESGIKINIQNKKQVVIDLKNAIEELANCPQLRYKLGKNAYNKISKDFNWENKAKHMVEIYKEILNENSSNT